MHNYIEQYTYFTMEKELDLYKKLAKLTQTGWYRTDEKKKTFECSDYIKDILGLNANYVGTDEFLSYIREDHRERIKMELSANITTKSGFYRCVYPVMTRNYGEIWFQTEIRQHTNKGKVVKDVYFGTINVVSPPQEDQGTKNIKSTDNLLLRLYSISHTLFNFLRNGSNRESIISILNDVRLTLNGDRVYIIEFMDFNRKQCNTYEVVSDGISPQMNILQNIQSKDVPWYTNNLLAERPIILDSLEQIPEEGKVEYKMLKQQEIKSLICVPMINRNGVWGYMGVDIVKHSRKWRNEDYQWLLSICNIISICMDLANTKKKYINEENFIRDLIKYMPIGYAHTSIIRDKKGQPIDYMMVDYNDELQDSVLNNMPITQPGHFGSEYPDRNLFERRLKGFKKVLRNKETVELDTYFPLSGKYVHEISYSPAKDQVIDLYIDTTDILKNKNQIKDFENFFSLISQFAKIGYAKFNVTKRNGYANKQWLINFNEKMDTPLTEIIEVYSTLYYEDRKRVLEFYKLAKEGKVEHFTDEVRVEDKETGKWKWIRMNIIVSKYEPENNEIEFIGVNYDITQSKNVEKELTIARNKAMTMDKLKSAFLANMSHEIRTPLNAIVGFSNLLADSEDPQEKNEYVSILNENNELLLQLISDILDLSKIEAGTFEFVYSDVDVNQLCEDIVKSSRLKAQEGVEILFDQHQDSLTMNSDRNRLHQLLSNFINNALKFTEYGSIKIGYEICDKKVRFHCTDTGIGIDKEQQSMIFERFVKLNNFVKGTGLGLSICQSIVQQMDGDIGVNSEVGKGSTFWFELPYITPKNKQARQKNKIETDAKRVRTIKPFILVAEDTESNYLLITAVLSKQYKIIWAHDGIEAVDMCRAMNPDLILMDLRMPRMNGLEATRTIREFNKDIPIIAVTAFAFEHDKHDAIDAGCNMFLSKPINGNDLRNAINKALDKKDG